LTFAQAKTQAVKQYIFAAETVLPRSFLFLETTSQQLQIGQRLTLEAVIKINTASFGLMMVRHLEYGWQLGVKRQQAFRGLQTVVLIGQTFRTCADSDLTDWSGEYTPDTLTRNPGNNFDDTVVIASYQGRVCHITTADRYLSYFDVDGKTVSNLSLVTLDMNSASNRAEDISTDGTTWIIAAREGDIWKSVNSGESWTKVIDDLGGLSDHAMAICSDVLTVI
jgi:hypothetical protein